MCKRAKEGTLHTETCASGGGCLKHGYATGNTITYGTIPGQNSPVAGDAYDCDVNNDDVYSPTTERFYFVRKKNGDGEKAVLVHYTSFDDQGQMDNSSTRGNYEYEAGKIYLPNSTTWSNPALTAFDGKVSRYISHEDLLAACGGTEISYNNNQYLSTCQFFLETSRYQSSNLGRSGIWVETLNNNLYRIQTSTVVVEIPNTNPSKNTVRPVIEIPITSLEEYIAELEYTITFDTHGGTPVASITKHAGETLGDIVTTREHYDFDGWYANYENDIYSNQVTASTVITEDMTLHAKWQPKETHTVTFDANGGTINGESTFDLIVDDGSTVSEADFPEAIYDGKDLEGWFIEGNEIYPFNSETVIEGDITVVAIWDNAQYVAKIGNTKYETLSEAFDKVPTGTSSKTRITILKDIEIDARITIPNNKWVELDIGSYTISDSADYAMMQGTASNAFFINNGKLDIINGTLHSENPYIIHNKSGATLNVSGGTLEYANAESTEYKPIENTGGTVNITGGRITCNGQPAAINNMAGGTLNISGGEIKGTNNYKGQAIYINNNSTVNISGDVYIENTSTSSGQGARAAVDNYSGTLTITGGTIVSKQYDAVISRNDSNNTVTIGINDEIVDTTNPVLRGKRYGFEITAGTANVYDGIFEAETQSKAISKTDVTRPSDFITNETIKIDSVTYHIAYLSQPKYNVTFYYDNGDDPYTVKITNGEQIGDSMPQNPEKTGYYFAGWYEEDTEITSQTKVKGAIEAHAKWVQSVENATITTTPDPFTIEVTKKGQISFVEDDIESVTYSINGDTIATVNSNGQVTGTGVGNTTITITGTKSGYTKTVTVNVTPLMRTITFDPDNGNQTTTQKVADGTSLTELPTPTKTNYIFDGWYIAGDSTTPFTTEVIIEGDLTVVASWIPSIELATIPASFTVTVGHTKTIEVTGPTDMESYTFSSSDNNIATITQDGNNATVTGVSANTTSITIKGSKSKISRYISVEVVPVVMRTVTFLNDDNTLITTEQIEDGTSFNTLPIPPSRNNYVFDEWYIDGDSTTPLTTETKITGNITVIANWKEKISVATITNNPDPFVVKVGNIGQITITATNGGLVEDCTFSSSNTNIAEIDTTSSTNTTGVVFGASTGTVTITITGKQSKETRTISLEITNLNTITFDPDNGQPVTTIQVADGETIGTNVPANPSKTDYAFDRWYLYDETNEILTTTPLDENASITSNKIYKAKWVDDMYYTAIDKTTETKYFTSIKEAIADITTKNETEIRIIQDITNTDGQTIIPKNKNVVLNGGSHLVKCGADTTNQLIFNQGTLRIISGTYTCEKDKLATLQNNSGCNMYIDGGTFTNTLSTSLGRGAIYNEGAVYISGGTFSSVAPERGVIQNSKEGSSITITGGTINQLVSSTMGAVHNETTNASITISGGTITSVGNAIQNKTSGSSITITGGTITAVKNAIQNTDGNLVIGKDDNNDTHDIATPVIQGDLYGVNSTVSYSIFDGIIKGKSNNRAVNNFDIIDETNGIEAGHTRYTGTDGDYYTLYYVPVQSLYHINFNANEGQVTDSFLEFSLNTTIRTSDLPTPIRANYIFNGWYKDEQLTIPFEEFTPDTAATVTYYAKWSFNSSFTPVSHNILSNAMQEYFTNIGSWVAADVADPSNDPSREADATNNYDNGHHLFKNSIDEVFTSNGCSYCGADNNCNNPQSGTYCDQPNGYDTGLDEDVNVYLYENDTKGSLVTYTTSNNGVIYNMIPGITYLWESASDITKYGVVTATGNRRTLKTSVRNLRDLGGLAVSNETISGTIDYGRLYRGAQITTAQGITDLNKLGITREVDVRENGDGNQSYKLTNYDTGTSTPNNYTDIAITNYIINPLETPYIATPHPENYQNVKNAIRAVMEKVVFEHDNIFFHCTIGTDRTGTIAYFLEGLLGVSEEDRLRDYELTYFFGLTNRTRFHDTVNWSSTKPRFYSMYRSYPTNEDIYNYYIYKPHVVDENNPNDLTDDELLRRFRLELIH